MLVNLHILHYQLLTDVALSIQTHFTTITGNSGSGKSMLASAIRFIGGAKIPSAQKTSLEAHVRATLSKEGMPHLKSTLEPSLFDAVIAKDPEAFMIERSFSRGKSKAWINEVPITQTQLAQIMAPWLYSHGQHAHLALAESQTLIDMLDAYAALSQERNTMREVYQALQSANAHYLNVQSQLSALGDIEHHTQCLEDAHKDDIASLDSDQLEREQKRLQMQHDFQHTCQHVHHTLTESPSNTLTTLYNAFQDLTRYEETFPEIQEATKLLEESHTLAQEASQHLCDADQNPDAFNHQERKHLIETQMSQLHAFCRKYQLKPFEIQERLQRAERALAQSQELQASLAKAETALTECQERYKKIASELHALREKAAEKLQPELQNVLASLSLPHAQSRFVLTLSPTLCCASGMSTVQCHFASSQLQMLGPIEKIASGGEMARVMLAMESLIPTAHPKLMVFDEADVGVSGQQALQIGHLLKKLATSHSVLCITHSAQVASFGQHHLHLRKYQNANDVVCSAQTLEPQARIEEIARLLSGETLSPAAIENAKDLCIHAESYEPA